MLTALASAIGLLVGAGLAYGYFSGRLGRTSGEAEAFRNRVGEAERLRQQAEAQGQVAREGLARAEAERQAAERALAEARQERSSLR